jgi:hypothetical protein
MMNDECRMGSKCASRCISSFSDSPSPLRALRVLRVSKSGTDFAFKLGKDSFSLSPNENSPGAGLGLGAV